MNFSSPDDMCTEELYGILEKTHKETGHGNRDRMIKHLNNGYANNSRDCIELFLSLCENCNMKKKHISKGVVVKATSEAFFEVSGVILQNFVRWS
jgi:hypothetical protein